RGESGDLVADGELAVGARIPELELGLRVDADDALPVDGRADHRRGRVAVQLLVVGGGRLVVERDRVRTAGELLVREVDARVDHRHGDARAGRDPVGHADVR